MKGRYVITRGIHRFTSYLLNPELGDEVITARLAALERAERRSDRLALPAILMWFAAFLLAVSALSGWMIPAHAIVAGVAVAAAIGLTVSHHRAQSWSLSAREEWARSGDAVRIDFLADFKRASVSEEEIWRAAHLYARARETARRSEWGREAVKTHRLAPDAEGALDDCVESSREMFREVAAILDPGGRFTAKWLLERIVP